MTFRSTNPTETKTIADAEGHTYVDVRTVEEFDEGHVAGAYNVPIAFRSNMGMEPNPAFLATIQRLFPRDAKLVFV